MAVSVLDQMEATGFFTAIRDSAYGYPILLWLHLAALAAWSGMVLLTAMQRLGLGFRSETSAAVSTMLRGPKRVSFVLAALSGVVLFGAKAGQYADQPWFTVKMVLLALLAANALLLHRPALAAGSAVRAKLSGGATLLLLAGMVWASRGPATIRDMMHAVVDPSAEFLFESVQVIADEQGVREIFPRNEREWSDVRRHIEVLLRAPDQLRAPDLRVGRPRDRSAIPEYENQPAEIQRLIRENPDDFGQRAERLRRAAGMAMRAAEARDKDALLDSLNDIDNACEACHVVYWYPKDPYAVQAARENGIIE